METYNLKLVREFRKSIYCEEKGYETEESERTPYLDRIGRHFILKNGEGEVVAYVLVVGHSIYRLMIRKEYRGGNNIILDRMIEIIEREANPYCLAKIRPAFGAILKRKGYEVKILKELDKVLIYRKCSQKR